MRSESRILLSGLAALLAACLLQGCGGSQKKTVQISGKITRGGGKLDVPNQASLQMIFHPQDQENAGQTYPADVDKVAGTYSVPKIPTGKYRIEIQWLDPYPTNDLLKGKYGKDNSPEVKDVTEENQQIDIDLPKEFPK